MRKLLPIIAGDVDTRLRNLTAILLAGGARDDEIEVLGYIWSHRAGRSEKFGKLHAIRDSNDEVVCYKQSREQFAQDHEARRHADPAESWQKAPSGEVHTMQLKVGRKGRSVPLYQRNEGGRTHSVWPIGHYVSGAHA